MPTVIAEKELCTADDPGVEACTEGGVEHDFRSYNYTTGLGRNRTSLRCVWCHAVTCGNPDEDDPCMEPYHHRGDHRSRFGVVWPLGGTRPVTSGR